MAMGIRLYLYVVLPSMKDFLVLKIFQISFFFNFSFQNLVISKLFMHLPWWDKIYSEAQLVI